jgi:hypothetical protein
MDSMSFAMKNGARTLLFLVFISLQKPAWAFAPVLTNPRRTTTTTITAESILRVKRGIQTQDFPLTSAKDIIQLVETRYAGQGNSGDWTKARNYLYHASLSITQVQLVLDFLEDSFCEDTIRRVLQDSPRILRKNPISNLRPTADFLRNLYGAALFKEAILRNPSLLLTSGIGYERESHELEIYLNLSLKISKPTIATLKRSAPFLFSLSVEKVKAVCNYLATLLERGGVNPTTCLGRIITAHPHLLNLSADQNLRPRMDFLVRNCHLTDKDVATLVQRSSGSILGLSVDDNLKPTLDYLNQLLNYDAEVLRKTVMAHAPLLGLSLVNLQQKVEYFTALGTDETLAARIMVRCPMVYSLSLSENIIPKIDFLRQVWGYKEADQAPFLHEYPGILTLSLEGNIQPTLHFFNKTGYTNLTLEWKLQPGANAIRGRYIAASLFQRLLPRWHFLQQHSTFTLPPPLHILVAATDDEFCNQLQLDFDHYQCFKEESTTRLKFTSQFDTWLKTGRPIDASTCSVG